MASLDLTFDLSVGPIVSATIGPSSFTQRYADPDRGFTLPETVPIRAKINTGSYPTVVRVDLLDAHGFQPHGSGERWVSTFDGVYYSDLYLVNLSLLHRSGQTFYGGRTFVLAAPMQACGCDCMIGRDFLRAFHLHYDGTGGLKMERISG